MRRKYWKWTVENQIYPCLSTCPLGVLGFDRCVVLPSHVDDPPLVGFFTGKSFKDAKAFPSRAENTCLTKTINTCERSCPCHSLGCCLFRSTQWIAPTVKVSTLVRCWIAPQWNIPYWITLRLFFWYCYSCYGPNYFDRGDVRHIFGCQACPMASLLFRRERCA